MTLVGTLVNGAKCSRHADGSKHLQDLGADGQIDAQRPECNALARRAMVDGGTAAEVAAGVAILAAIAHMQLAPTVSATQQTGEQGLALA
jgi:hypothetical protein